MAADFISSCARLSEHKIRLTPVHFIMLPHHIQQAAHAEYDSVMKQRARLVLCKCHILFVSAYFCISSHTMSATLELLFFPFFHPSPILFDLRSSSFYYKMLVIASRPMWDLWLALKSDPPSSLSVHRFQWQPQFTALLWDKEKQYKYIDRTQAASEWTLQQVLWYMCLKESDTGQTVTSPDLHYWGDV